MGFRSGTTCFKYWITINIVPFLLSMILIIIRVVIAKSQIFWRIWYRQLSSVWGKPHCRWKIWIFFCVFGFGG